MSNKLKIIGTPVPDDFKKELILECDLNLSFKEKLKLLLGYLARVRCRVLCLNSPGRIETFWAVKIYDPLNPTPNEPTNITKADFTATPGTGQGSAIPGTGLGPTTA